MTTPTTTQNEPILLDLMVGFEALTRKVDELVAKNSALEKQLKTYTSKDIGSVPLKASRQSSDQVQSTAPTSVSEWRENDCFAPGIEAWKKLKEMRGRNVDAEKLERDFTTQGRIGDLRCPFAQRAARRLSRGTASSPLRPNALPSPPEITEECMQDPIAAEFHPEVIGSPAASVQNSTSKCPIRFLDDHSPEEVAKYFENHKHEIPRSHEICVKRYQSNEQSIRQLDAKYGNLVNMIQGLGVKHQPMLPVTDEGAVDQKSSDKIEKWAEKCVSDPSPAAELNSGNTESEIRTGHFERPLQEVRLGESPSRPWGIQVPLEQRPTASVDGSADSNAAQSIAAAAESRAASVTREPIKRCPFSQFAMDPPADHPTVNSPVAATSRHGEARAVTEEHRPEEKRRLPTGVVFNGPVFFGYPAADVEAILRSLQ